ncbi:methyltransferase domain-containing protein [Halomarina litorea]|uniref:methyltransferase domain-containing protein n=1 Tax=Halomarina litorea TaxID=2961595 RepID=UPI0020C1BB77|nr:methyltransferase domain-containing protein [Halomarina sp. BCD28]
MYVLELGGEDDAFARCEAASACTDVRPLAAGLATARGVSDRVHGLAYTHRASALLGHTDASVESARALLDAASFDREGSVAVRARDVKRTTGVDTQRAERELGSVLVDRGFSVDLDDPDHELRALFSVPGNEAEDDARDAEPVWRGGDGTPDEGSNSADPLAPAPDGEGVCALGWLEVESVRDYGDRRPTDRPFFQPGSMGPLFARALVNVAGARPGARVLDPMCGTGGVLVEAGLVGGDVVGADAQAKMVRGARENLAHFLEDFDVCRGDATHLPFRDASVDAVVFDAPYGRQSKVVGDLAELVEDALREARRVAPSCVVVADRSWREAAERAGWTVEATFERRVHRSLDRHVLVLR